MIKVIKRRNVISFICSTTTIKSKMCTNKATKKNVISFCLSQPFTFIYSVKLNISFLLILALFGGC